MQTINETYSNNQLKYRWIYLNGTLRCLEDWYSNGQLKCRWNYFNGRHGFHEGWDVNGKQKYKSSFINNKSHGMQIYNGNISYYKYGIRITKEEYEQYINSIKKGILNILSIGKNTLDLIIARYLYL